MKLIEKLAKEAADQHCGYEMNDQINVLAQMAFRSGFCKAREMAATQVRMNSYLPPEANCLEFRIEAMGEQEVPHGA